MAEPSLILKFFCQYLELLAPSSRLNVIISFYDSRAVEQRTSEVIMHSSNCVSSPPSSSSSFPALSLGSGNSQMKAGLVEDLDLFYVKQLAQHCRVSILE
jgi:hypothetical protein